MEQNQKPRNKGKHVGQLIHNKRVKNMQEKGYLFSKMDWKTGQPCAKE